MQAVPTHPPITTTPPTHPPLRSTPALPKQDNHWDCGLFLCAYVEYFVHRQELCMQM